MHDYRIEKVRRPVEVTLTGGQRLDGDVFCQSVARFRPGAEEPLDLLNDDDPFLPVAVASGEVMVVQKAQIALVTTALPEGDDAVDTGVLGMRVEFVLVDGSAHQGTVFPELPADRQRLLDFLNDSPLRFLAVFTADRLRLVNRVHIAYARSVS